MVVANIYAVGLSYYSLVLNLATLRDFFGDKYVQGIILHVYNVYV